MCNWSRASVTALLPAGLDMAQIGSGADTHPVVFIFGEQTEGAVIFGGLTFPFPIRYGEFCMAVPFVMQSGDSRQHTFVPCMYSGYFPAVWHGNAHFGFSKQQAAMQWSGPMFVMTGGDGRALFHANVEAAGDWIAGKRLETLPNLITLREMFALPILGRKSAGSWVTSSFDWGFDDARVRPAKAWVAIDGPILPASTPGTWHADADGTFDVDGMLWRLGWPSTA